MIVAEVQRQHTPQDLLTMPDGNRYELVDGRLVEKVMSTWASYVGGQLFHRVENFNRAAKHGWVLPEGTSYCCFPDNPNRVRRADVSFIRRDRMSLEQATTEGHSSVVPDLAAEVVSPNDLVYEVDGKVEEWLRAGVQLVWVVNPETRTVKVYRANGSGNLLRHHDSLDGEDVLPGFHCRVEELFEAPFEILTKD